MPGRFFLGPHAPYQAFPEKDLGRLHRWPGWNAVSSLVSFLVHGKVQVDDLSPHGGISFLVAGMEHGCTPETDRPLRQMQDLSLGALDCTHDPLYRPRTFTVADLDPWIPDFILDQLEELTHQPWMPSWPMDVLQSITFSAEPIQLHASAMAIFASIIGPFGTAD